MPSLAITYFDQCDKAEPIRLMSVVGGLPLKDDAITGEKACAELLAKVAPQQFPLLEVDGVTYGQSIAQSRYVAKLAGLYPTDPLESLKVDELVDYAGEVFPPITQSFGMTDNDERDAFRLKAVSAGGDSHKWLSYLDSRLAGKKYAVGDSLSWADIAIFCLQPIRWLEGIPANSLDGFKNLQAHAAMIANEPKIKEHYKDATGVTGKSFKF